MYLQTPSLRYQTHILYIDPPPTHSHIRTYTCPPSPAHHLHIHVHLLTHTRSRPCICVGTNACPYPVPHLIFHAHTFTHRYTHLTHTGIHVESPHSYTYRHPHADTHRHICTSHPFSLSPSLSLFHTRARTHTLRYVVMYTLPHPFSHAYMGSHTLFTHTGAQWALSSPVLSHTCTCMHTPSSAVHSHAPKFIYSIIHFLACVRVPINSTHTPSPVLSPTHTHTCTPSSPIHSHTYALFHTFEFLLHVRCFQAL